jgi:hypothetical protein
MPACNKILWCFALVCQCNWRRWNLSNYLTKFNIVHFIFVDYRYLLYTVKGTRGKVSFESQYKKYASQLSCDASPEMYSICHILFTKWQMRFTATLSYKYASDEASQDSTVQYSMLFVWLCYDTCYAMNNQRIIQSTSANFPFHLEPWSAHIKWPYTCIGYS